jgi:hypothetical protein
MSRSLLRFCRTLTVLGATAMLSGNALAVVESSCPAPCPVAPKTALFVREAGNLAAGGSAFLPGTLQKGVKKTVLRVDATFTVDVDPTVPGLWIMPTLNGINAGNLHPFALCESSRATICTVSATFWWDIDALEAAHPGQFVGQPLDIILWGGNNFGAGSGLPFQASFAAQVVKKQ